MKRTPALHSSLLKQQQKMLSLEIHAGYEFMHNLQQDDLKNIPRKFILRKNKESAISSSFKCYTARIKISIVDFEELLTFDQITNNARRALHDDGTKTDSNRSPDRKSIHKP